MKQISAKTVNKRSSFIPDDDNARYKLNTQHFNNVKSNKTSKKEEASRNDDDIIRYKLAPSIKLKSIDKPKPKPSIKVNFWSKKQNLSRLNVSKESTKRRHTIGGNVSEEKPKTNVKVRKRVSFLPSPIFNDNHIPMVTVPDDLTIQLNEEEANDLGEDLNNKVPGNGPKLASSDHLKRKAHNSYQSNTKSSRRKPSFDSVDSRTQGNEYELEFFSKYVVQKLRRMETNQRIYSENLINTVLMLGQLGKLNGKSKITEA